MPISTHLDLQLEEPDEVVGDSEEDDGEDEEAALVPVGLEGGSDEAQI